MVTNHPPAPENNLPTALPLLHCQEEDSLLASQTLQLAPGGGVGSCCFGLNLLPVLADAKCHFVAFGRKQGQAGCLLQRKEIAHRRP